MTADARERSGRLPFAKGPMTVRRFETFGYALLCVLVVSSRAAYVIHDRTFTSVAGAEVERAAANLAREGSIGRVYSDDSGPSAHVAPLYPFFLAGVYRVFGWNTPVGRVVQEACAIMATTVSLLLLPLVARRSGLQVVSGWTAAILLAILPLNLWVESSGSWEQPYAAVTLLVLVIQFCRLRAEHWASRRHVVLTGVVIGLSALLCPALVPAAALMLLVEAWTHGADGRVQARIGLAVITASLVVAPWVVRNARVFGAFIPIRGNFGLELAIGNNDFANGKTFGTSFDDPKSPIYQMHPLTSAKESARVRALGERAYMQQRQREAMSWIRDHPWKFVGLTARRARLFWFPPEDLWSPSSGARALKATFMSLTALLALSGLLHGFVTGLSNAGLLAAAMIGPSLVYLLTHIDARNRYPVTALTTLLACQVVLSMVRSSRQPSQVGAAVSA